MFSSPNALRFYLLAILLPSAVLYAQYPGPPEIGMSSLSSFPSVDARPPAAPTAQPATSDPWDFDAAYPTFNAHTDDAGSVSVSELQHPLSGKARSLLLKAKTDLHEGKIDDCMNVLENAMKERSAIPYIYGVRGAAYLLRGSVDDAIVELEKAVNALPVSANYSNLGFAHLLKGDVDQAEEELRHALNLHNSAATRYLMGLILLDRKPSMDEACDDLQQGQSVTAVAPLALAVCYARDGQASAANNLVREFVSSQPDSDLDYWQAWVDTVAGKPRPSEEFGIRAVQTQ